jgi:type IV fimbrial biogenesis protein FimT
MKFMKGFTLIEMLIAILLSAILIAIGVPNYKYLMQNMNAMALSTDFTTALAYARNEAIRRVNFVTICPAANTSLNSCGAAGNWSNGWIIFVDPNATGTISSGSTLLKVREALETGTSITTTQAKIIYTSGGALNSGVGTFTLAAPGCSGGYGRIITLTTTGLARIATTTC